MTRRVLVPNTEIEAQMTPIVAEIAKSQEFHEALSKAAILQMPSAIQSLAYRMVGETFQNSAHESADALAVALGAKLQTMRNSGRFG